MAVVEVCYTMQGLFDWIHRISRGSAVVAGVVVLALIASLNIEVFSRYVLGDPTKWAYDISTMLGGSIYLLAAAYVYHRGEHVRVDVLYERMSPSRQRKADIIFMVVFFAPLLAFLTYFSFQEGMRSVMLRECSNYGFWKPPLYPFKAMLPFAFALLLLEGIVQLIERLKREKGSEGDV